MLKAWKTMRRSSFGQPLSAAQTVGSGAGQPGEPAEYAADQADHRLRAPARRRPGAPARRRTA